MDPDTVLFNVEMPIKHNFSAVHKYVVIIILGLKQILKLCYFNSNTNEISSREMIPAQGVPFFF